VQSRALAKPQWSQDKALRQEPFTREFDSSLHAAEILGIPFMKTYDVQ
jgi:hypothetical protein